MSEHYDPDIQAMKDYEALNADTALQLNKAKQEIERLEMLKATCECENKRLRAALERIVETHPDDGGAMWEIAREALREVGDD